MARVAGLALYALAPDVVAPKVPQSALSDQEALLAAQEARPRAETPELPAERLFDATGAAEI